MDALTNKTGTESTTPKPPVFKPAGSVASIRPKADAAPYSTAVGMCETTLTYFSMGR